MFNVFILLSSIVWVWSLYIPPNSNLKNETAVAEIQNALCTITTKELEASANATITRELRGVCTTSELNLKIDKLQTRILQEIDDIKYILELNGFKMPDKLEYKSLSSPSDYSSYANTSSIPKSQKAPISPRLEEILTYNDTARDSTEGTTYYYYWKIANIHQLLRKTGMYISSPDFFVLGHKLHLQFYPNHLQKNFGVQLRPDSSSFLKKHRITVFNQVSFGADIISGTLYGIGSEKTRLQVSKGSLTMEGFIVENALIVKLEIFLDS